MESSLEDQTISFVYLSHIPFLFHQPTSIALRAPEVRRRPEAHQATDAQHSDGRERGGDRLG